MFVNNIWKQQFVFMRYDVNKSFYSALEFDATVEELMMKTKKNNNFRFS